MTVAGRALVTGGSSGIGAAIADRLATEGWDVVVADVTPSSAHTFRPFDAGDPAAWDALVADEAPFDAAFLNAGIATPNETPPLERAHPLEGLTDAAYRAIMAVNIDGVVFGARTLLPGMLARGRGDLVATASMAALVPIASDPIYGLTKHAVAGFVKSLGTGLAASSVCVSALCPAFVDTNIISAEGKAMLRQVGITIMDAGRVADVAMQALAERRNGALWTILPDQPAAALEPATPSGLVPATTENAP